MDKSSGVRGAVRAALAALSGVAIGTAGTAIAQDEVAVQEKVTVTGSRIKRVDVEGPQPVTVISREEIDGSGNLNVADVLRKTTYNTFGSQSQQSGNTSQSLNSINLRGVGADKTLVLVNGRRLAGYAAEQGTVQNLTLIPLAAVERIEVLRDGASAIYGTDAIAGVVNIITRKDYEGVHLSADWGRPTQNGGDEDAYSITGGVSGAKGNVTFAFDSQQRDLVFDADRSFSSEGASALGYPSSYFAYLATDDPRNPTGGFLPLGIFADPRCPEEVGSDPDYPNSFEDAFPGGEGICRYTYASTSATIADNDTKSFFVNADYDITENTTFYAQGLFSHNESFGRYAPSPVFGIVWSQDTPNNPTNPANPANADGQPFAGQQFEFDTDGDGVNDFQVEGPFDLSVLYRNVPTGPRDSNFEDTLVDYVAGVEGTVDWLGGMDWQLGANWSRQSTTDKGRGFVLAPSLNTAIENGELDIFGVQDTSLASIQEQAGGISFTQASEYDFRITGGSGQVNFDAFQIRNGPVPVALGFEYRDEDFNESFDQQTQAGNAFGAVGQLAPVSAARAVKSLFAETNIPILGNLELNLAARYDDYNDFGTTINPKASVAFRPLDVLLLRATYGKGFQAPDLRDLYSGQTSDVSANVIDTWQCSMTPEDTDGDGRANVPVEDLPAGHPCNDTGFSNVFSGVRGGNRDLQPTESDQWTAGFVLNLFQDLTLNVDYYYIDITDEVDQLTYQQKLDEEFALRQAGATGDAVGDVTRRAGGRLDTVTSLQTNIGTKKTEGLDAEVSYGFSMGRFGDLNTTLYWTHVLEYEESDVDDPTRTLHLDGTFFYPKNRGQLAVNWNMGDYSATVVGNYISRQNDAPFCADDDEDCYLASWVTWDVQVAYATPWNGMITVGARNVFDRDPPDTDGFWDNWQADVFGRVPYIRWEQEL